MNLNTRIEKLEQVSRPTKRCFTCREWPATHVTYDDRPAVEALPGRCPDCGFSPLHIAVVHEDALMQPVDHTPSSLS